MPDAGGTRVIQLHPADNVCVAVTPLEIGSAIESNGRTIHVLSAVPMGHKVATSAIGPGEPVRKYGQIIGHTTQAVRMGEWVHTQNLAMQDFHRDHASATCIPPDPEPITGRTFLGYRRSGGRVGTRNYVAVISTVNCSASVSKYIARRFGPAELAEFPHVDGVVAFTHYSGCGLQFAGTAHAMLNRVLAGMAQHPNIGAYVLVGLGCEQAEMDYLLREHRLVQIAGADAGESGPPVLTMQDQGGTARTVEAGVAKVRELLPLVNAARREPFPASEIILATNCGGSDGNSGITANPALGVASDMIVACGGTTILAETTEIYGAEHLLTRRARTVEVADKLLERIEWWKWYTGLFGVDIDNNPSVGNKKGGLTTIAEKSLGAVAKAGSTALIDVVQYAEPVRTRGLVIMDTPGYDPASVTGLVAGGANIVVFTTGRGSCFGCKPTPSIKVATNTPMYNRMRDDMDINAGVILEGTPVEAVGKQIFEEILDVASGKPTKSEQLGIGDEEFIPWTVGPTL
ncbi:MAG: UxaA family hydrolase [Pirellulaceae bacterium]